MAQSTLLDVATEWWDFQFFSFRHANTPVWDAFVRLHKDGHHELAERLLAHLGFDARTHVCVRSRTLRRA